MTDTFLPSHAHKDTDPLARRRLVGTIITCVVVTLFCTGMALFMWQDNDQWRAAITDFLAQARGTVWALPIVCLAYIASGFLMFPITLLNLIVAIVFGFWGIFYGLIGVMMNAVLFFWIGTLVKKTKRGQELLAQPSIRPIDKKLHEIGLAGMVAIHALPAPPYTVMNFIAGLSSVTASAYLIGTFLAMLPGATARGVVGESLTQILLNPTAASFVYLAGGLVLWVVLVAAAHFLLSHFQKKEKTAL